MPAVVFGQVVPCRRCHLTGRVPAEKQTKLEARDRARENSQRRAHNQEPLERPARWVVCQVCDGAGYVSAGLDR